MIAPFKTQTKQGPWIDRGWYLVTEFEKTPSIHYKKAITLAQTHPGFIRLMDERNILIYRNMYREHDLVQFQELYKLIKNWKGTRLYFKGDEVEYDTIESGIQCYVHTKLLPTSENNLSGSCEDFAKHQLETSLNLGCLGCRRSGVSMGWNASATSELPGWFFFGTLDRHNVYNINKDELKQLVIGHLTEYASCPLFDFDQIARFIECLPDRIDPRKDREWVYNKNQQTEVKVQYYKNPEVVPTSKDAYRAYMKRKLLNY